MDKKVLVTGASGFIGSHLIERLVRDGRRVKAFVRYNGRDDRGRLDRLPREVRESIEVFRGDLKDPEAVRQSDQRKRMGLSSGSVDFDPLLV